MLPYATKYCGERSPERIDQLGAYSMIVTRGDMDAVSIRRGGAEYGPGCVGRAKPIPSAGRCRDVCYVADPGLIVGDFLTSSLPWGVSRKYEDASMTQTS